MKFFFLSILSFLIVTPAHAALLYIDPQEFLVPKGGTFSVKVRIDPQGECINAATVALTYNQDIIKAIDVGRGESIFGLWPENPHIDPDSGVVYFSGGIPGGYCGRTAGDPGLTNVLAEVVFQSPGFSVGKSAQGNTTEIAFLGDTQVLLNDGSGTTANLTTRGAAISVGEIATSTYNPWFELLRNDKTSPEAFSIELTRNEDTFQNRYFIVFGTEDKQSGIDHYEVYETDLSREGIIHGTFGKESFWKEVNSPYLLVDQTLNSKIKVRAFDKAGNQYVAELIPDESLRTRTITIYDIVIGAFVVGTLLVLFGIGFFVRRRIVARRLP